MIDLNAVRVPGPLPVEISVDAPPRVCLDLGAGQNPREGFIPVDAVAIPGMNNIVHDLSVFPYPWEDSSVDEVHLSHVLEHFTKPERAKMLNEIYRILKPGGLATIITPCDDRHAQDPTHKDSQVVPGFYGYFNKEWREANKLTHNEYAGFTANFGTQNINYTLHPAIAQRNDEHRQFAAMFYKNAVQDLHAVLVAIK